MKMEFNTVNTIKSLTLLELPTNQRITEDLVKNNYRQLCKVYHPDASSKRYKDGERFKDLREAYEYIIDNIDGVNQQIASNFSQNNSQYSSYSNSYKQDYYYEAKCKAEEERQKEEARRKAEEERQKEEARRKAEEERQKEAKQKDENHKNSDNKYTDEAHQKTNGLGMNKLIIIFLVLSIPILIINIVIIKHNYTTSKPLPISTATPAPTSISTPFPDEDAEYVLCLWRQPGDDSYHLDRKYKLHGKDNISYSDNFGLEVEAYENHEKVTIVSSSVTKEEYNSIINSEHFLKTLQDVLINKGFQVMS